MRRERRRNGIKPPQPGTRGAGAHRRVHLSEQICAARGTQASSVRTKRGGGGLRNFLFGQNGPALDPHGKLPGAKVHVGDARGIRRQTKSHVGEGQPRHARTKRRVGDPRGNFARAESAACEARSKMRGQVQRDRRRHGLHARLARDDARGAPQRASMAQRNPSITMRVRGGCSRSLRRSVAAD